MGTWSSSAADWPPAGGSSQVEDAVHPPGRRRLRSAVRSDGYETWTIEVEQYDVLRAFILDTTADLDDGTASRSRP